jgi:photosystem II stability/assembly factor-like uncharacterized protein
MPWAAVALLAALSSGGVARAGIVQVGTLPRLGSRLSALAAHPTRPEVVLVGTEDGFVMRSDDGGVSWLDVALLSPREIFQGRIRSPDSRVETLFGWGGPNPHFNFYLRDHGLKPLRMNLGQTLSSLYPPITAIYGLKFDPQNPLQVWAATGAGLYKSRDGGRSFSRAFVPGARAEEHGVRAIAIDPRNSRTVLAGAETGLFVSRDAGATFRKVRDEFLAESSVADLAFDPVEPGKLYAATAGSLAVSPDGGEHWGTSYYSEDAAASDVLSVTPLEGGVVWITTRDGLFLSEKGGEPGSWVRVGAELTKRTLSRVVVLQPPDELVVFGDDTLWYSASSEAGFRPVYHTAGREAIAGGGLVPSEPGGSAERVWIGTSAGLFQFRRNTGGGLTELGAVPGPLGPTLSELRQEVRRLFGMQLERTGRLRDVNAVYKYLIPRLSAGYNMTLSNEAMLRRDAIFPSFDYRYFMNRADSELGLSLVAMWDLRSLVFSRDRLSEWGRLERDVKFAREQMEENLTRAYGEWRQVTERSTLPGAVTTERERLAYQLRIDELEAYMNGLSRGYFERKKRKLMPSN